MANEVEAFERATRRSRMIKLAVLGLVVTSPLIWVIYKNVATRKQIDERREAHRREIALTEDDKQALRAELARARKSIEDAATTFVNAVTPATLEALEDSGNACPHRLNAPTRGAADSYLRHGSIDMNYFGDMSYAIYAPGTDIKPGIRQKLASLDDISQELATGTADRYDLDRAYSLGRLGTELFIVGERKEPAVLATSFLPGQVTGFAYLYSYAAGRIVCFASLAVQNSEAIDFTYTHMQGNYLDKEMKEREAARAQLDRDLDLNIRYALASRLHATL